MEENQVEKWVKKNIYKAGSKEYYRDSLQLIFALTIDYDGFSSPQGLKSLIDDIKELANDALEHKKLYLKVNKEEK